MIIVSINRETHTASMISLPRDLYVYMPNRITVSYTHLRAHETVLDTVCRLLLETTHITSNLCYCGTTTI